MVSFEECTLLGLSILQAQRLEFSLYGVVSHLSHLDEAKKDKRFRELTAEKFLRWPVSELKATFGQIEKAFGDVLLISCDELAKLIEDRNTIAHNYWRLTNSEINQNECLDNPRSFLMSFISDCEHWQKIFSGLLYILIENAAKNENRIEEISFSLEQKQCIEAYTTHAIKVLNLQ